MAWRHQQPQWLLLLALTPLPGLSHRDLPCHSIPRDILRDDQRVLSRIDDDDGALEPIGKAVHVRLAHEALLLKDGRQLRNRLTAPPDAVLALVLGSLRRELLQDRLVRKAALLTALLPCLLLRSLRRPDLLGGHIMIEKARQLKWKPEVQTSLRRSSVVACWPDLRRFAKGERRSGFSRRLCEAASMAAARSAAASSSQPLLSADSSLLAASEFDPTAHSTPLRSTLA
jgi:hypothetical protein